MMLGEPDRVESEVISGVDLPEHFEVKLRKTQTRDRRIPKVELVADSELAQGLSLIFPGVRCKPRATETRARRIAIPNRIVPAPRGLMQSGLNRAFGFTVTGNRQNR